MPDNLGSFVADQMHVNAIETLAVSMRHALYVYNLPDYHRDPFDRLLVAQARLENLPILTDDPQIACYPVEVIW